MKFPKKPKQQAVNGSIRQNMTPRVILKDSKPDSWLKASPRGKALIIMRLSRMFPRKDSFRIIMALVAHFNLELHQMDVKTVFLNGDLHEDVYMAQPEGFAVQDKEHLGCQLKKSIYGLKQASRQ